MCQYGCDCSCSRNFLTVMESGVFFLFSFFFLILFSFLSYFFRLKTKSHPTPPGFHASLSSAQLGGVGSRQENKQGQDPSLAEQPLFCYFFFVKSVGPPRAKPCHTRMLRTTQVWVCREQVLPPLVAQNAA